MTKKIIYSFLGFIFGAGVALGLYGFLYKSNGKIALPHLPTLPAAFVILSGSMEPTVRTGSVVFIVPQPIYIVGDIVTFAQNGDRNFPVTHRIYKIDDQGIYYSDGIYTTKGDANKTPDMEPLTPNNIIGKVWFTIPYLGYAIDFMKRPQGFILFVIVPATIIIYEELKNVKREIAAYLRKLKISRQKALPANNNGSYNKLLLIIPVVVVFLIGAVYSKSYFSNQAKSDGNVFGAATSFAAPTPTGDPISAEDETVSAATLIDTPTATPSAAPATSPTPVPPSCDGYCQSNGWTGLGCTPDQNQCTNLGGTHADTLDACAAPDTICCCKEQ
jgi:signal peptidase I